jgi:Flp pilus assembly protein TadG
MKNTCFHRFWRCRQGTAAVEFAIVGSTFFLIVMGILDYGWALWNVEMVQGTAAATARCVALDAALSDCSTNGTTYATTVAGPERGLNNLTASMVSINRAATCGVNGVAATQVTITFPISLVIPVLVPGINSNTKLVGEACFP